MLKVQNSIAVMPLARARSRCAIGLIACLSLFVLPTISEASDWPKFRKGLWLFERTLAANGSGGIIFKRETTRCVDPSEAKENL